MEANPVALILPSIVALLLPLSAFKLREIVERRQFPDEFPDGERIGHRLEDSWQLDSHPKSLVYCITPIPLPLSKP
ncbi:uncharacterized protein EI90DRAFT_1479994 [Cantharellus anzutake]|uniref:uncharacterized protein n=1 Tax=Cantharellus anzutake TaxID=1750568 RepID=UPI001908BFD5|nr:uncharacterized protein EI90DRAFT_1479994 [Cantharellus anzutake]KAF8328822.1 hypothetical protein EI90DRAFT_1479994 [Cantharellus anzutake]